MQTVAAVWLLSAEFKGKAGWHSGWRWRKEVAHQSLMSQWHPALVFLAGIHLWERAPSNWFCAQKLESVVTSKNMKVREHLLPYHRRQFCGSWGLVAGDPKKDFVTVG